NETAGRVPFTASRVFERIYGESLGALWRDYERKVAASVDHTSADDRVRRLTHHQYIVTGPRFDRSVCSECAGRILYSVRAPHDFPGLYELSLDGMVSRKLTKRYLGSTTAIGPQAIYFDQAELRRNTGLYNDLYVLDRRTGHSTRLTHEARLIDPDLSSD